VYGKSEMINRCRSGGAKGADTLFGDLALAAGHEVIHWSFQGHYSTRPDNTIQLNAFSLSKADIHLIEANKTINRKFPTRSEYVNNLLRRNYYQVLGADRVYASCAFDDMKPRGGTAWALVMAINLGVPEIYNFDWVSGNWYQWGRYADEGWDLIDFSLIPRPHGEYAGIGSSELPENGAAAIRSLYEKQDD
jgi:hypothetical protein